MPDQELRQGDALAACGGLRDWHGCYSGQTALWVDEAYAHPAKAHPALAYRILQHLEELGLLKPSDVVLDPMAGTGTFGLAWAAKGGRAILVELEPKFIGFCQANKAQLEKTLGHPVNIEIIQGDARHLGELLKERGLVSICSPPYLVDASGEICPPEYRSDGTTFGAGRSMKSEGYGSTPGQIGALPDKPLKAITSPPYGDIEKRDRSQEASHSREAEHPGGYHHIQAGYQGGPGNIGNLPDRPLKVVTSPPYEDSSMATGENGFRPPHDSTGFTAHSYGEAKGQIGQEQGPTYLNQMKIVYAEIAKVADVLVTVTKDPTRGGKLRELCKDTQALLEATGWRVVCHHKAILFEEQTQGHLFEGSRKKVKGRMSFFKRLQWQKGKSEIAAWEDVLVAVRDNPGKEG